MKNYIKIGLTCGLILLTGAISAQARGHDDDKGGRDRHNYQSSHDSRDRYDRHDNKGYRDNHNHDRKGFTCAPAPQYRDNRRCDCGGGYWKRVERRVFVPASFTWTVDHCGSRVRIFKPASWKFVTDRVWVSGHGPRCRFG